MSVSSSAARDDWRVETLRLTAFPAPGQPGVTAQACWSALFGLPYQTSTEDVRTRTTRLRGSIDDAFMEVTRNPVSFELRQLASNPAEPPGEPRTLSSFSHLVLAFQRSAVRWLRSEDCPSLRRLAFGAVLLKPVPSPESAHNMLNRYLPAVTVDPGSSDLLYQINRRRSSEVIGGLRLNRLSKWSAQQVDSFTVSSDGTIEHGPAEVACRVELDINSVPSHQLLPADRLPRLLEGLVILATEIARQGDIS